VHGPSGGLFPRESRQPPYALRSYKNTKERGVEEVSGRRAREEIPHCGSIDTCCCDRQRACSGGWRSMRLRNYVRWVPELKCAGWTSPIDHECRAL